MKLTWWHWLLIAFGVVVIYKWRAHVAKQKAIAYQTGESESAAAAAAADAIASRSAGGITAVMDRLGNAMGDDIPAWGGIDLNPAHLTKADQDAYPGWYRTGDGGWIQPETGDYYSPGSSPPSVLNAYQRGDMQMTEIDLSAQPTGPGPGTAPAQETHDLGSDVVY